MDNIIQEALTNQIIREFSKTIELFGLNPSEARLFSFLYLSGEALTLDEMSEGLGKSKTAISTNVRSLLEMNLVQRVWKKGVRKDLYQANSPLFKTFMKSYVNKWVKTAKDQKDLLESIQDRIEEKEQPSTDMGNISDRLKEMVVFHKRIESYYKNGT